MKLNNSFKREDVVYDFISWKSCFSIFELDESVLHDNQLSVIVFEGASEDWLNFVLDNRLKVDYMHSYDIVKGSVADDRVYTCLNAFENKFMDFESSIKELRTYKLDDQISFHSDKALGKLKYRL